MSDQTNHLQLLSLLSFSERLSFRISSWVNRHLKQPFMLWNALFMYFIIWLGLSRRLTVTGLENIAHLTPKSSVLLASNHRTFFDFFVITWINFDRTSLPRNIYFPVRSNFFYDNILGLMLNVIMGGCAMYPPIFRSTEKKPFNRYSMYCIAQKLREGGVTIGFHPEGTRNKDPDPFTFLPAKPGIGYVIKDSPSAVIIPVFSAGLSNNYPKEIYRNWVCPEEHPIVVCYGKTLDFSQSSQTAQEIATEVLSAIEKLSQPHQERSEA